MPINNSRELIPFVNLLEEKIIDLIEGIDDWEKNKFQLIATSKRVDGIHTRATSALVRADEAMSELSTATFRSTAKRGKRLEDTINELKKEMYEIAASVPSPGDGTGEGGGSGTGAGGGELTTGRMYEELNNAISSVDPTIKDGLKLDYRLREIQSGLQTGADLGNKDLHLPYKYEINSPTTVSLKVPDESGVTFVDGDVTVLDYEGNPFLDDEEKLITGVINSNGGVLLTAVPKTAYVIYFPVQMKMKDIPEDFLALAMNQVIQKNSHITETMLRFGNKIDQILQDIDDLKGVDWNPDFSVMRNHQDIVKEGITPKGIQVEVKDGMTHVMFNYNDHPQLSHFILERWNEEQKKYLPYDGEQGIVNA